MPALRKYPDELCERATRMVMEARRDALHQATIDLTARFGTLVADASFAELRRASPSSAELRRRIENTAAWRPGGAVG